MITQSKPADGDILNALRAWGEHGAMTYMIRNSLVLDGKCRGDLTTAFVRRRLQAMEKLKIVKRAPTNYAVQICWAIDKGEI